MNSPRQIAQSVAIKCIPATPYIITGIRRNALFLRPVAAICAAVWSRVSKVNLLPQRMAHRTIEFSPRAQINAQSKAAKMITMLVSKLASLLYVLRVLLPFAADCVLDSVSRSSRCGRWWTANIAIIMTQSNNTSEVHQYPLSRTTISLDLLWVYANRLEISWLQCFLAASNRTTKETASREFISLVYRTRPSIVSGPGFLCRL